VLGGRVDLSGRAARLRGDSCGLRGGRDGLHQYPDSLLPLHDPDANKALFESLEEGLEGSQIEVEKHQLHINDELFAGHVASAILEVMRVTPRQYRLSNLKRRKWSFDHGASVMIARRNSQIEIPDAA